MMKEKWKKILLSGLLIIAAFAVWTALILTVDVQPVGQKGTYIGFAALNTRFHSLTGVHMKLYTITDWLGLVPVAVCIFFAGIGLRQLIQRKSLYKVDADIIVLGVYYAAVIIAYCVFEVIPVNYRPVLIGGALEASYPSSTTLLVLCVMPAFAEQLRRRLTCLRAKKLISAANGAFSAFMVIGRLISGVHWFTDIVGGVLLSAGLYTVYKAAVSCQLMKNSR